MSRFLSRAGSSIDALHRQLSRRSTVDDTTTRQPGHLPPHIEETPPTPRMTIPSRRAFGSSPPQTSSGLFSRSPLSTSPLSTHSQSRQPPISSPPTNDASTSSPPSTRRSRFNFSPTLPSIPAGNTFTTFRTMVTQNYGSIVPTWTVSKNPPTVVKSSSSVHSAPSDTASPPRLETFDGVFVPTVLSIWGIILFLRFGFIIAQAGVMGTLGMFGLGYLVNILTTLSLSAISTNGTVRGGGPYYLISRSLGPEFGGSIGLVFYLGNLICGSMSVLGFVEPLLENFGRTSGELIRIFPEGPVSPKSWRWWI
ncbi:amino acid permease-domain-containing protein [Jimgerdemannia flammicorona]|uniref:Amino acid permease-domain-containing protein n=1 Tax=Jimgerdemannia flammicorona TaxID=994334 RepID=A0A433DBN0_9FUNG|nr:amino acid permease-domain-containing protein [Jimgerdemannia flammicorona]